MSRWLYRNPGQTDYTECLSPKDANNKDDDIFYHIRYGSKNVKTRFISTTKSLDCAINYKNDNEFLLLIDVDKIKETIDTSKVHDLSTRIKIEQEYKLSGRNDPDGWTRQTFGNAATSQEIIFEGVSIPRECYIIVPWKLMEYEIKRVGKENAADECKKFIENFPNLTKDEWDSKIEKMNNINNFMMRYYNFCNIGSEYSTDELDKANDLDNYLNRYKFGECTKENLLDVVKEGLQRRLEDQKQINIQLKTFEKNIDGILKRHTVNIKKFNEYYPSQTQTENKNR